MIPYSTQDINEADVRAVVRSLVSGWLTQGPAVEKFEKDVAKKVGAKYAVAFNSGTAALHAAYFAAGVRKGDEVIVPSLTFAATANAVLYLGAKPIFADSDPNTGNMSVSVARAKITKKTKAVVCPRWRSVDLDVPEDWVMAELLYKNKAHIKRALRTFT
jgi:dTDP-4-amino-4,6-dideoxygalactose transaminase